MITVLKGADFSENNIGRITVPVEYSAWTLEKISLFPSYNWSTESKNALEYFYRSLVEDGIMEKLEYLALPVFASDLATAVQNLAGTLAVTGMGSQNLYSVVANKGLARTSAVPSGGNLMYIDNPRVGFMSDFHFAFCTTDSVPDTGETYSTPQQEGLETASGDPLNNLSSFIFGFAGAIKAWGMHDAFYGIASKWAFFNMSPFMYPGANIAGVTRITGDKNFSNIPTTFIACASNNKIAFSCGRQAPVEENLIATDSSKNNTISFRTDYTYAENQNYKRVHFNLQPFVIDNAWYAQHYGVLSFGQSLTNEQNLKYQKAISDLIADLDNE